MAKGKKTGGRDIVKGQVLNPYGNYRSFSDVKLRQHASRHQIFLTMFDLMAMNTKQIEEISQSENQNCIQTLVASVISVGIKRGCYQRLNCILQYMVGRPQTVEELDDEGTAIAKEAAALPDIAEILKGADSKDLLKIFTMLQKANNEHSAAAPQTV